MYMYTYMYMCMAEDVKKIEILLKMNENECFAFLTEMYVFYNRPNPAIGENCEYL